MPIVNLILKVKSWVVTTWAIGKLLPVNLFSSSKMMTFDSLSFEIKDFPHIFQTSKVLNLIHQCTFWWQNAALVHNTSWCVLAKKTSKSPHIRFLSLSISWTNLSGDRLIHFAQIKHFFSILKINAEIFGM